MRGAEEVYGFSPDLVVQSAVIAGPDAYTPAALASTDRAASSLALASRPLDETRAEREAAATIAAATGECPVDAGLGDPGASSSPYEGSGCAGPPPEAPAPTSSGSDPYASGGDGSEEAPDEDPVASGGGSDPYAPH